MHWLTCDWFGFYETLSFAFEIFAAADSEFTTEKHQSELQPNTALQLCRSHTGSNQSISLDHLPQCPGDLGKMKIIASSRGVKGYSDVLPYNLEAKPSW